MFITRAELDFIIDLHLRIANLQKVCPECEITYDFQNGEFTITAKNGESFKIRKDFSYDVSKIIKALKRLEII